MYLEDAEKARKSAEKNIYGDFLNGIQKNFPKNGKK